MPGKSVLDKDQSAEESIRPDFRPDGSHDDLGMSDDERQSETDNLNDSFYQPESSAADIESAESSKTSGDAPTKADASESNRLGNSLYNDSDKKGLLGSFAGSKKGKWIGASVVGSIVSAALFGIIMLPLKVMHIANNLQGVFFSSSEQAAEDMSNRLLAGYLIHKVMPGMVGDCTTTLAIKSSCKVVADDDYRNPVGALYRTWKDNRLEVKLAEKQGLEIRREGNRFYVSKNGNELVSGIERNEGNVKAFEDKMYSELSRKEVRREMLNSIENETFFKRIMYRYKYGSLMERKYGVIRCIIACDYRNDRADRKELRKMRFQAWFIHRTVGRMNEAYSLALECSIAAFACAKEDTATTSEDGDKRTKFETDLRARVTTLIGDGRMTQERLDAAQKEADDLRSSGISNYLSKKILGEGATKFIGSAVPFVGWIDSLSRIIDGLASAGPAIKTMNYVTQSGLYVTGYMYLRTNADEVKPGTLNVEELGYVTESLGEGYGKDQGGLGAEGSPYYQDVMGTTGVRTASLFPRASAASIYTCNDGSSITSGLCPEMTIGGVTEGGKLAEDASKIVGAIPGLEAIASAWLSTGGKIYDLIGGALGNVIGALTPAAVEEKTAELTAGIGKWFSSKLLVNPYGDEPSGARMFEAAAMGANVAGNDYAHYGLGAGKISNQAANNIRYARATERQKEFSNQPFLARMFDTSTSHSLVSQIALSAPTSISSSSSVAAAFMNPVKLFSSAIPTLTKTNAAPVKNLDMGGVTQYGYTGSEEIFKVTDYEKYWDANDCSNEEKVKAWGDSSKVNPDNGSFENDAAYPCKLLDSAVSMNGAYYSSDEFLSSEELGTPSSTDFGSTGPGATFKVASYNIPSKRGWGPSQWSKAVSLIRDREKFDIVGLQEISPRNGSNYVYFKENLPGYGLFPDYRSGGNYCADAQTILYNRTKFELVKSELLIYPRYNNNDTDCGKGGRLPKGFAQAPIIWLTTKDYDGKGGGQTVIVMNTHNAASGGFGDTTSAEAAKNRYIASQEYVKKINQLRTENPGVPIIFTGDFNEGTGVRNSGNITYERNQSNLFFCMITNDKIMKITEAPNKDCSGKNGRGGVDYIYVSQEVAVDKSGFYRKSSGLTGSDHEKTPVYATITIKPSSSGNSSSSGWSWPMKKNINDGPCYGGPRGHAGLDMNSSSANNPVLAMNSGKVVRRGSDGAAGNYITILADVKFDSKPVYYSYQHLKSGSIKVNVNDRVSSGQEVAIAGKSGNVSLDSSAAHLHIVTATTNTLGSYGNLGTTFDPMKILGRAGAAPEGYKCTNV